LLHWFIFGVARALIAQTVFYDDFSDGSAVDGVPVGWTVHENAQGSYSVIGDDYVAIGNNPDVGSQVMSSHVRSTVFDDVAVQAHATTSGNGATAVIARSGYPNSFTGYGGSLNSGGFLAIFRTDGDILESGSNLVILSSKNIDFNSNEEVKLQLEVIGSNLSLTAWKADEPKPAEPQLTSTDTLYSRGWAGVAFQEAESDPAAFAIFRYVQAVAFPTLAGDFNHDGTVDAADYVVWRKGLGTTYTQADYDAWRVNFGRTAGDGVPLRSAEGLPVTVPEPSTAILFTLGVILAATFLVSRGNCWTIRFHHGRRSP
jgi:hypothetical protein